MTPTTATDKTAIRPFRVNVSETELTELRRRIKLAAAQKDLSIREYIEDILEEAVPPETTFLQKRERGQLNSAAIEDLLKTRAEIMRAHPGQVFDSVETLHELREERLKELEQ